ncbi:MAG: cyclic nucleotide-binding domain-containing protein [Candidatus Binatia bacterium]|nr:cyclic nucleotide-binding domain-containing protein [Candidatus Binatia bacterium]
MNAPDLVRLPGQRLRGRVLLLSKVLIVLAAILTLVAVNICTALTLSLFLIIGQAAIVAGASLALFVAATDFLRTRGTSEVHFDAGETVFRQGDTGDLVYVIVTGEVEAIREDPDGEDQVLATMGAGEYFGEMALLSDAPRTATVRARTDLDAIVMARADFTTLYAYLPNLRVNVESVMNQRQAENRERLGSKSVFKALVAGATSLLLAQAAYAAGDAAAGKTLYNKHGCAQCHGIQGKGDGYLLPMLKEKPEIRDWTAPGAMDGVTDEFMIEITEKGGEGVGKSEIMLKYGKKLTKGEIINIVAYIRSLQ